MRQPPPSSDVLIRLSDWQRLALPALRQAPPPPAGRNDVTALAYFFWDDARIDSLFYTVESAFRMTWRCCGRQPSVLVTNRATPAMQAFCAETGVTLDVDPTLTGGVPRMNLDCIRHLHRRFATEYVLIVQSDGFPLRSGLDAFVGPYDYVGAPWLPPSWYTRLLFPPARYSVGNGGLTLRSRRICEQAAWHYQRRYKWLPYCWFLVDDVFYARVLPRFERSYRQTMRFASPVTAARFSFEANESALAASGNTLPFGFHSSSGFQRLQALFPADFPRFAGADAAQTGTSSLPSRIPA